MPLEPWPPKLLLLDPWNHTHQYQHTCHNDGPQLDVQHIRVEASLSSRTYRRESHRQDDIAANTVVFIYCLAAVDTSEDLCRNVELSEADKCLAEDQDVGDQAYDAVGTCKPSLRVAGFIHLDYNQAGYQSHYSHKVQCEVNVCAIDLLFLGVGRL